MNQQDIDNVFRNPMGRSYGPAEAVNQIMGTCAPSPAKQVAAPVTAKEVAAQVLEVLRHLRDNEPAAWDALMQTQSSPVVMDLWDTLRIIAN